MQANNLHEILNGIVDPELLYGTYVFTITATLEADPTVTASYELTLTLTDPCLTATLDITNAEMDASLSPYQLFVQVPTQVDSFTT